MSAGSQSKDHKCPAGLLILGWRPGGSIVASWPEVQLPQHAVTNFNYRCGSVSGMQVCWDLLKVDTMFCMTKLGPSPQLSLQQPRG